ncbi:peptide chain release factor N(5)-glutamine methyltransferase [Halpernia frigidisoli]|uniref:peptide chain release factor N(5)-glutamine methyltransferase n=1 Tax=Halpernia frigidisoli TaxID=1125876 RepID=A0A1I3DNX9_9FLAO|nr:peptide chain release factor N(5)-glutamine methyltransferase [Halpernia frigidisoli]SFH88289.1 release factor glutamine methyltransferase [Halpernia frigidisoli]
MTLEKLKSTFSAELSEIYTLSEILELFSIFVEEKLNFSKIELRNNLSSKLSGDISNYFLDILKQLKNEIPYQYILGKSEFFGLNFKVSSAVLIPRPETEELLELAIRKIKESRKNIQELKSDNYDKSFKILDIGTGSGIIPIILKKYFQDAEISSIDFSQEALEIAKQNAENYDLKIDFIFGDYLSNNLSEKYDVIISNPPYIGLNEENEIEDSVKNKEPKIALFSPTSDPLIFYKKIAEDAKQFLNDNGQIFLEINQKLGKETLALFQNFSHSELLKDMSGNDRFIFVIK